MQLVKLQAGTERVTNEQRYTPYYLCDRRTSGVGWAIRNRSSYRLVCLSHHLV